MKFFYKNSIIQNHGRTKTPQEDQFQKAQIKLTPQLPPCVFNSLVKSLFMYSIQQYKK